MSDLWTFIITASAEGCLSACTVFLIRSIILLNRSYLEQNKFVIVRYQIRQI